MSRSQWVALKLALCLSLAGCGANMQAALRTAQAGWSATHEQATEAPASPAHPAVWVKLGGQAGWMVRADGDGANSGSVSHWYSSDGALLRLSQGRLIGFTEATRSWRTVSALPPVDWRELAEGRQQLFERVIDEQPGYRLGQRWERVLEAAKSSPPGGVAGPDGAANARWFVERSIRGDQPSFWYAVDLSTPTPLLRFGHACLKPQWCLIWAPSAVTVLP